jgi:RNA polymerase sigma factor (sigma-70 family)
MSLQGSTAFFLDKVPARSRSALEKPTKRCQDNESRGRFIVRLFDAYYDPVFSFSRKYGQADAAADTTQEVFTRLIQHPHLEDMDLSVSDLIKVAQNIMRSRYSRSIRTREMLERLPMESSKTGVRREKTDRDTQTARMDRSQIDKALQSLTAFERDAIRLIVWEGMSYDHAACSLKVNVSTVNNWKFRGLSKLRAHVAARDNANRDVLSRQESA